jgi:hypothetical protein
MACGSQRIVRIVGVAAALALTVLLAVPAGATEPGFEETRIPHRDGSGRATIVEIDPAVPGAREFIRNDERPAPARGEVSLPTPTRAPAPSPSPARSR